MTQAVDYFGSKAGEVWAALDKDGPATIAALKKRTKLSPNELYAGLAWLACERKLAMSGTNPLQYKFELVR
jgi:hypothetical protein